MVESNQGHVGPTPCSKAGDDTAHVWATLGRWASWGDDPPQLRATPRRSNLQGIAMTVNYKPNEGPDLDRWHPFPPVD